MNFLFWSKLLPLFLYPVGLVFLLLVLSFILWWKFSRWLPFPLIVALIVLFGASNSWLVKSL